MSLVLWILTIALAAIYAITGAFKLAAPRERLLATPGMGWVEETPMPQVRVIALLEIAGAIGIVAPWATGILPALTPLAALGLVALQVGAMATHLRRDEREHLALNVILLLAALVLAIGRLHG